ncbi:MAG: alanine--tRNA ligase [Candidatus Pacearchaeota archaeon]
MVTRNELIKKYFEFFKSKNHKIIPSASLIPQNDPTVLFTTAGMHPLVPYLLGEKHPLGKRLVGIQKCIRTTDIDDVGDETHHTFFEMLGNWSLGDYWKEDAIKYSYEFLTKELKIPHEKISVTCFKGDKDAPKDIESEKAWKVVGVNAKKIKFLGKEDNWWGPAGATGPCGPDTEMFYKAKDGKEVEIWNDVFMEYNKTKDGTFLPLQQKNVDTGMGVERTLAILNGLNDNYETEVWKPIIDEIEHLYNIKYNTEKNKRIMRIIADHTKASVFLIADGVTPSNKGQGYVLRKLIRRAHSLIHSLHNVGDLVSPLVSTIMNLYANEYEGLEKNTKNWNMAFEIIRDEEGKFGRVIDSGKNMFNKLTHGKKTLSGKDAFLLYQSYGFPIELTQDLAKDKKIKVDKKAFEQELSKHQQLSRTASAGTFKSGLADHSEKTVKLHTATHLLNEALRRFLGKEVKQCGSNITPERLRFDFNFPRKLTEEELKKVENIVNQRIKENLKVTKEEMPLKKAIISGAQSEFGMKYPEVVSVYTIGSGDELFSKEICTGPHVKNTKELGQFKITKEEAVAAGIRRIKATVT